jgi:para-nitrobenzyl esterase
METNFSSAIVNVTEGFLQGSKEGGLTIFKGIPFAKPPVGDLRWRAPEPPKKWRGPRDATRFGGEPIQPDDYDPTVEDEFFLSSSHRSEDCLYLNVYTPAKGDEESLPVFVWIHGGGFQFGAGSHKCYHGDELAAKGSVVVVTLNYRLGIFGFFAHPELAEENEYGSCGNYALFDQIAALKWVKANISSFGGNPDNITIGGQSAGSASVGALLASPLAAGLFKRCIMQSGPVFGNMLSPATKEHAMTQGLLIAEKLGAKNLSELRAMDEWELFDRASEAVRHISVPNGRIALSPIVDGWLLPESPSEIILKDKHNHVDIITGSTSEEFGGFRAHPIDPEKFERYISTNYPEFVEQILTAYPHSTPVETAKSVSHLGADYIFSSVLMLAEQYKLFSKNRAYVYYYDRPIVHEQAELHGAPHGSELPYLFGKVNTGGLMQWHVYEWDNDDHQFCNGMMNRWIGFIKNGEPGYDWTPYNNGLFVLELGKEIKQLEPDMLSSRLNVQSTVISANKSFDIFSSIE